MTLTRGIRGIDNLNPLNVKQSRDPWFGSIGQDEIGHAIFTDPAWSVRCTIRLFWKYQKDYGIDTLRKIFERYAPTGDGPNNPNNYAEHVSRAIGVSPMSQLNWFDPNGVVKPNSRNQMIDAIEAMVVMECGTDVVFERRMYQRGMALYHLKRAK